MITPNSYKAQQEGQPYQPQPNADRMQGADGQQQAQQQWTGEEQAKSASRFEEQPTRQYQEERYTLGDLQQDLEQQDPEQQDPKAKSKIVAALLAFFLTPFGAANFYLKYIKMAILQLVLNIIATIFLVLSIVMIVLAYSDTSVDMGLLAIAGIVFVVITSIAYSALLVWAVLDFIRILTETAPYDKDARGIRLAS